LYSLDTSKFPSSKREATEVYQKRTPGHQIVVLPLSEPPLKPVAAMKGLLTLDLRYTKVTDVGLKDLAGLKTLTVLDLMGTAVTDDGIKEFQRALPKCRIEN
jgi:hypothetical protein